VIAKILGVAASLLASKGKCMKSWISFFLTIFQLFRKDLISAMKLPDNEPLEPDDYWTVQDTWKQEWEKGVQVKYTKQRAVSVPITNEKYRESRWE
jgi:hypothetical protein